MCINLLKLNDDKIGFIVFGMAHQLKKIDNITVKVGDMETQLVQFVRNLGYFMDCFMKNAYHINKLCSQLYLMLWKIQHMRSYLDQDTVKKVVQTFIMSKLDYCNSVPTGFTEYQLDKYQRI